MDKLKNDITAHITTMLTPLKAMVEWNKIRWENQCQAVIDRERSAEGQSCNLRNVNIGTPVDYLTRFNTSTRNVRLSPEYRHDVVLSPSGPESNF